MSLLARIAISKGNEKRKTYANRWLAIRDDLTVAEWNEELRAEIDHKIKVLPPSDQLFMQGGKYELVVDNV